MQAARTKTYMKITKAFRQPRHNSGALLRVSARTKAQGCSRQQQRRSKGVASQRVKSHTVGRSFLQANQSAIPMTQPPTKQVSASILHAGKCARACVHPQRPHPYVHVGDIIASTTNNAQCQRLRDSRTHSVTLTWLGSVAEGPRSYRQRASTNRCR